MMFRSPERSLMIAALTPSSVGLVSEYTAPSEAGTSPAMALSNVDLPDPFEPTTPIASPS